MEESDRELCGRRCRKVGARTPTEVDEDIPWKAIEDNHRGHTSLENHPYWLVRSTDNSRMNVKFTEAFASAKVHCNIEEFHSTNNTEWPANHGRHKTIDTPV